MTKTITIICDHCQKEIHKDCMPTTISIMTYKISYELHYCSYEGSENNA